MLFFLKFLTEFLILFLCNFMVKRRATTAELLEKYSPIKNGLRINNEDRLQSKYDEIIPNIYLGNYRAAKDIDFFKEKNIKAVLNCTKDIPNYHSSNTSIEYMRIPIDDSLEKEDIDKLYKFLPSLLQFIRKHVETQKQNILIHCYAGRQRSAASVAAYLMYTKGLTPLEACKYIVQKRKEAFHYGLSLNFEKTLIKYHQNKKGIFYTK